MHFPYPYFICLLPIAILSPDMNPFVLSSLEDRLSTTDYHSSLMSPGQNMTIPLTICQSLLIHVGSFSSNVSKSASYLLLIKLHPVSILFQIWTQMQCLIIPMF